MILECMCDENGANSKLCDKESGQCTCNPHVVGLKCKACEDEYWAFPDCQGRYLYNNYKTCNFEVFFR